MKQPFCFVLSWLSFLVQENFLRWAVQIAGHLFILNLRLECLAAQLVLTLSNFLMLIEEMRDQNTDSTTAGRA